MPDELIPEDDASALRNAFEQLQKDYSSIEDSDEGGDDDETSEDENPDDDGQTPPGDETPPDDEEIDLGDGVKLKKSDIAELHRLRQFLDGDTTDSIRQSAQALERARQQTATIPPAEAQSYVPPAPPEGLDLEDPALKALWDRQISLEQSIFTQNQSLLRQQSASIVADVERAVTDWNGKYKLDDKTLDSIRQSAAESNVAVALENTGKSTYDSVHAALEAAFWGNSDLRNKYLLAVEDSTKRTKTADQNKQRKLSALNGRGSSAGSHKAPSQMTREERNAAMINDIAAAMSEN